MSMCALSIYAWDKWGHKWPRRWMVKYGGLSIAHAAEDDPQEFKEYSNLRRQIQNSIRPITIDVHEWPGAIIQ